MQNTDHEDLSLLNQLKNDDATAFRQLYDQFWRQLYAIAYNRLRQVAQAEDVVQEVFVDLWDKRQTLLIQHSLRAYLYASVKNKVLDQIRRSLTRERFVQHILATAIDQDNSTEHQLAFNELDAAIDEQINRLPNQRRLIVRLSRREQLSYHEIAQRLNLSPKTVENQLSRALKTLRWELRDLLILVTAAWWHS